MTLPLSRMPRWALLLMLSACAPAVPTLAALDPAPDAVCSLDGMVLADYPASKGQIRYADGKTEYFCDVMELLGVALAPEQKRAVAGMYVQDMAQADWTHPAGHWIAVRSAFFVTGSGKAGSMGPTIVPFASEAAARAFSANNGGAVRTFAQLDGALPGQRGGGAPDDGMGH